MTKEPSEKIDRQIGANLARLRALRGLSQADLGNGLSTPISYQAISKYESGASRIPSGNLAEFAVMLKCRVSDLFEGVEGILRDGEPVRELVLDRQGEKLMRDYQQINNPALQSCLANMAHAMVLELTHNFRKVKP